MLRHLQGRSLRGNNNARKRRYAMEYRDIGNTGMKASVVGLGTEHLDEKTFEVAKETIDAALEHGINIMDVFMPGTEVRTNIGRALAGRREKVLIQGHIGSVDLSQQYDISRDLDTCKRYFENLLRCLGTDYIDLGMLFFLDSHADIDAVLANGIVEYARDLKKRGVVRAIGASTHNPDTAVRLVKEGLVEMMMFSINPAFDLMPGACDPTEMLDDQFAARVSTMDPARAELYRLCQSRGVGITVMKTLGAGKLLSPEHTPFAEPLTVGQCIHYALTRPAVASVLIGCQSRTQVEEAAGYLNLSETERDYASAVSRFRTDSRGEFKGSCVYCNHCLPCPSNIDIAALTKYLDIAALDVKNIPPSIRQHYSALENHGSDCISCGSCEERCPFSVPVMANMRRAAELFGK